MKRVALIAMFSLFAVPAMAAEDCTAEKSDKLSEELFAYLEEHPEKAQNMEAHIATVEKEYGGEPSEAETCDALMKLRALVEADGG